MQKQVHRTHLVYNFNESKHPILDVFGPTVQFVMTPEEAGQSLCILKSVIPPGSFVPMHSHEDVECFYMISGYQAVLIETQGELNWIGCNPGDFIQVPGGAKHAFRNRSSEAAISLCATTAKLGRFFEEVGRPLFPDQQPAAPTPDEVEKFVQIAMRYGYWLATPDENAAVGVSLAEASLTLGAPKAAEQCRSGTRTGSTHTKLFC
jgi:quercetin dioxygenase-like cupin family protein